MGAFHNDSTFKEFRGKEKLKDCVFCGDADFVLVDDEGREIQKFTKYIVWHETDQTKGLGGD